MNKTETTSHTFRCTAKEWKQISDSAKEAGISANQYLHDRALSPQNEKVLSLQHDIKSLKDEMENLLLPLAGSSRSEDSTNAILEEIKSLRPGLRFLALAVKDRLFKANREDDYREMVEEAMKDEADETEEG